MKAIFTKHPNVTKAFTGNGGHETEETEQGDRHVQLYDNNTYKAEQKSTSFLCELII